MSIWKTPTLTCSVCANEDVTFGAAACPECKAGIVYDVKGNVSIRKFIGSLAIIKVGRYFFMGLMALLMIVLVLNLMDGETEGAAILGLLIVVMGLIVVGMYWLLHFVVNKFVSRNGIKFVSSRG